jgi:PAS domain S-box-containing protein
VSHPHKSVDWSAWLPAAVLLVGLCIAALSGMALRQDIDADLAAGIPHDHFPDLSRAPLPEWPLTLPAYGTRLSEASPRDWSPWLLSGAIALCSLLMAAMLRQQTTGRRRAEARAREMTVDLERLALVARRTSNAVIITDADRRITWVNEGFERITGYRAAEVLGRSPSLLQFGGTDARTVARMRAALQAGEPFSGDLLNRGRNGGIYWVEIEIQPLRECDGALSGFMAIESDITARRMMDAETKRSGQLLRGAIEALDEAFVLYGPDDRLVLCNEKYRGLHASSRDLVVPGARFADIVRAGAERGRYDAAIGRVDAWVAERLAEHRSGDSTEVVRLADGRVLRVVNRRMPDGHVVGFRIDITELVRATEAAEQASRGKSDFIATMSHELRTPLQSILGFSELGKHFANAEQATQFEEMFGDVHAAGQRMLKLVNGLLDVSKFDGKVGSLALCRRDVAALSEAVVGELRPQAAQHALHLRMPEPLPQLLADVEPFRLQQVLRNVLANALRFAPAGTAIEVAFADNGAAGVEIGVRDHGPGIPPGELETIFDAFVQSSRTRDGSGGTGLGLTICRRIMNAHGGTIEAANAAGGGALMRIRLPAAAQRGATDISPTDEIEPSVVHERKLHHA